MFNDKKELEERFVFYKRIYYRNRIFNFLNDLSDSIFHLKNLELCNLELNEANEKKLMDYDIEYDELINKLESIILPDESDDYPFEEIHKNYCKEFMKHCDMMIRISESNKINELNDYKTLKDYVEILYNYEWNKKEA